MLVYASFAGGLYAVTADEAQPAFGAVGLHLTWQVYAIIAVVLVMALASFSFTLAAGIALPLAYPPVRRGIANSPLLKAGASALLERPPPSVISEHTRASSGPAKPRRPSKPG